jgi:DNA adenine methylase
MTLKTSPFVKWAGGKKQLLSKLKERMPNSYLNYYEPFIGGGALLFDVQPEHAVINDTNSQLLNCYRQLKNNYNNVINEVKMLDSVSCDKERYYIIRDKYNKKILDNQLDAECAALMIWINKHCFNGLYRVNKKGLFNVPYNNKVNGPSINEDNLRDIGLYLNNYNVDIREGDFEDACVDVKKDDFVYFDSPYVPVTETANFTDYTKDGFTYEDHVRLSKLYKKLDKKGAKIMLSNNDVPLVYELYGEFNIDRFNVRRAINRNANKRKGKEVIITNYSGNSLDTWFN